MNNEMDHNMIVSGWNLLNIVVVNWIHGDIADVVPFKRFEKIFQKQNETKIKIIINEIQY